MLPVVGGEDDKIDQGVAIEGKGVAPKFIDHDEQEVRAIGGRGHEETMNRV